jgi:hypothetical protein
MVVVQGSEVKGWTEEECFSLSLYPKLSIYISVARFADGDDSVVLRMVEVAQLCEGEAFLCWVG